MAGQTEVLSTLLDVYEMLLRSYVVNEVLPVSASLTISSASTLNGTIVNAFTLLTWADVSTVTYNPNSRVLKSRCGSAFQPKP